MSHATIDKSGAVDFPQWVKVLAWVVGLSFPVAVLCAVWIGNTMWTMKEQITEMRTELRIARDDSYGATSATAAHEALVQRILRNEADIKELQRLHGR